MKKIKKKIGISYSTFDEITNNNKAIAGITGVVCSGKKIDDDGGITLTFSKELTDRMLDEYQAQQVNNEMYILAKEALLEFDQQ